MAEEKKEQKDLTGVLFKNDKRDKDTSPLYMGNCTIEGKKYYISAWVNRSNDGTKQFMTLRFNEPKTNEINDPNIPPDDLPF